MADSRTEPLSVSVVIPCYNRSGLLVESVASVQGQSYPVHEIIVVDDGSTEDIAAALSPFDGGDTPVRLVRHDVSRGANAARNTGARLASGCLLAFQDSDDLWLVDKLARQIDSFEAAGRPEKSLVYCDFTRTKLGSAEVITSASAQFQGDERRALLWRNIISTQTVLLPRAHFLSFCFDEDLPRLQDWDAWLSMLDETRFIHVNEVLVHARESSDSVSRDPQRYRQALLMIGRKHHGLFVRDSDRAPDFARRCVRAARKERRYGEMVTWTGRLVAARLRRRSTGATQDDR